MISARLFAYFLDLKTPKFVTGYSSLEADVALRNGEIDSRANNVTSVLTRLSKDVAKLGADVKPFEVGGFNFPPMTTAKVEAPTVFANATAAKRTL